MLTAACKSYRPPPPPFGYKAAVTFAKVLPTLPLLLWGDVGLPGRDLDLHADLAADVPVPSATFLRHSMLSDCPR